MPRIKSANPDNFKQLTEPSTTQTGYVHGADVRRSFIPVAFQVTSPYDNTKVLLPHSLVMHVNPANFNESFTKKVERIQTRGGWVEQHWGDDLTEISADGSTGAFMNIYTGLASILRRRTIAWDRFRDLHDLFRNNGSLYDPSGAIVLQGAVMLMYDRGTYIGTFRSFEFEETADAPFTFHVSWNFKVTKVIFQMPLSCLGMPVFGPSGRAPVFQGQNTLKAINYDAQKEKDENEAEAKQLIQGGIASAEKAVKGLWNQSSVGKWWNQREAEQKAAQQAETQRRQDIGRQEAQALGNSIRTSLGVPTSSGGGALPSGGGRKK